MKYSKVDYWEAILEDETILRVVKEGHGYIFQKICPYEHYVTEVPFNIKDDKELLALEQFIQSIRKGKV
mgnify:CR=1 FL=1